MTSLIKFVPVIETHARFFENDTTGRAVRSLSFGVPVRSLPTVSMIQRHFRGPQRHFSRSELMLVKGKVVVPPARGDLFRISKDNRRHRSGEQRDKGYR